MSSRKDGKDIILQTGDLVIVNENFENARYLGQSSRLVGIVLQDAVNIGGEETIPSRVRVLWADSEIEIVYSDEINKIE